MTLKEFMNWWDEIEKGMAEKPPAHLKKKLAMELFGIILMEKRQC